MEQNQFEVMVVHNGEDALAVIEDFEPDLILLDIMLPAVDGFQVCREFEGRPATKID